MHIYLDHNAGAPMRPAVRAALAGLLAAEADGNPASIHRSGQRARRELERAREHVARLIGAPARAIVFTSGGTEVEQSCDFGAVRRSGRRQIVTTAIEHSSILAPLTDLEGHGFEVERVAPDSRRLGSIRRRLRATSVPRPRWSRSGWRMRRSARFRRSAPLAEAAKRAGALFHLDAAQAAGRIPLAWTISAAI